MDAKQIKQEKEQKLIEMVSAFCDEKLNKEYKNLCIVLIKKMGRKRTVPFVTGKLEIWASAVINAIGSINFLFDKSFKPYISASDIYEYFGTKNSTVSTKARLIKDMFNMSYYDREFSTSYMNESNPFNDLVMVDDLTVPIDALPEEYQQMVREARARGEDISFRTNR